MAGFVDSCRFSPTLGGTTDWTYSSVVTGCQNPTSAGMQNGRLYKYRAESADLTQWEEGEGAYNSGTGVLARTTVLFNSSGTTAKISFSTVPQVAVVALKEDLLASDEIGVACGMTNGTLVASASSGALTVAVKTVAGNDPSTLDPVFFYFRDNTLTTGDTVRVAATAALSVVVGSTKSMGVQIAPGPVRLRISAHNNAGTVQIGAINCIDSNGIFRPLEHVKYTTTVPGSTSKAFVSTSAIGTAAPWRFIGFVEWSSLASSGTWTAPDIIHLTGPGDSKPGDIIGISITTTSTVASSAANTYGSTLTTGLTNLSIAPTLSSACSGVRYSWSGVLYNRATVNTISAYASMFRGSAQIGAIYEVWGQSQQAETEVGGAYFDLPLTTTPTYAVKMRNNDNSTQMSFPPDTANTAMMMLEEISA